MPQLDSEESCTATEISKLNPIYVGWEEYKSSKVWKGVWKWAKYVFFNIKEDGTITLENPHLMGSLWRVWHDAYQKGMEYGKAQAKNDQA